MKPGAAGIGILALQGDFDAHRKALVRAGTGARLVRQKVDLEGLTGLVLPGGESTTMLRLLAASGLAEAILSFASAGGAVYGTCAGAILLARRVHHPSQPSLGLIDIEVARNAYGTQIDSFETRLDDLAPELRHRSADGAGPDQGGLQRAADALPAVFIRAPRIVRVGEGVRVLARHLGEPVLVAHRRILVSTFHPELTADGRVHRFFLETILAREAGESPTPSQAVI